METIVMFKDIQKTVVIAATIVITTIALVPITSVMAQPVFSVAGAKYNFGTISSVQLDKNSKPDWILSGHWRSNLLSISSSNQTNNTTAPVFDASFEMIMVNGSALHRHTITNFALTKISTPNTGATEFNGTVAISLSNGPVSDVPISIKFMGNNTISIWLDPRKIQNHFENNPIFGTVFKPLSNFAVGPPRLNMR